MQMATFAIMIQLVLVLLISMVSEVHTEEDGQIRKPTTGAGRAVDAAVDFARYATTGLLYGSFTVVCIGLVFMEPPDHSDFKDSEGNTIEIPVSATTQCTIFMALQYFLVYLSL